MKEILNEVFEIILNDEKEANKLLAIQTIEEMYEYFKNKIPNLTENEFDDYLSEVLEGYENNIQNNLQKIDKENLDKVAGGRNLIQKLSASALTATSLLTGVPAFANNNVNTGGASFPTQISRHAKSNGKNQNDQDSKFPKTKCVLKDPCVKAAEGNMGLGALVFGGPPILNRALSYRGLLVPSTPSYEDLFIPIDFFTDPQVVSNPIVVSDPNAHQKEDRTNWNPLHKAAEGDEDSRAQLLTMTTEDKKRCFEARDSLGRTPLYIAFKYGQQSFFQHLIDDKNFNQLYPTNTNLMWFFFVFDAWCTAAKLDDTQTLNNLYSLLPDQNINRLFLRRYAATNSEDYSCLNLALSQGASVAYKQLFRIGQTVVYWGYSLLDISFRHNSMHAAEFLMQKHAPFNIFNIFYKTDQLTAKNKLDILNFLKTHAPHHELFKNYDGRNSLINCIFGDSGLSDEDRLEFLRFLKNHNYDFRIKGYNTLINESCAYLQLARATNKRHGTVLFKFYVEECNILSYMNDDDRQRIKEGINRAQNNPAKRELLEYFNQKCREQPYNASKRRQLNRKTTVPPGNAIESHP